MTGSQETPENGYYHSRYDHLNVDAIVNSRRLVQHYAACLLDKGPCPPQGAELKRRYLIHAYKKVFVLDHFLDSNPSYLVKSDTLDH